MTELRIKLPIILSKVTRAQPLCHRCLCKAMGGIGICSYMQLDRYLQLYACSGIGICSYMQQDRDLFLQGESRMVIIVNTNFSLD